jgi:hypothetical protein
MATHNSVMGSYVISDPIAAGVPKPGLLDLQMVVNAQNVVSMASTWSSLWMLTGDGQLLNANLWPGANNKGGFAFVADNFSGILSFQQDRSLVITRPWKGRVHSAFNPGVQYPVDGWGSKCAQKTRISPLGDEFCLRASDGALLQAPSQFPLLVPDYKNITQIFPYESIVGIAAASGFWGGNKLYVMLAPKFEWPTSGPFPSAGKVVQEGRLMEIAFLDNHTFTKPRQVAEVNVFNTRDRAIVVAGKDGVYFVGNYGNGQRVSMFHFADGEVYDLNLFPGEVVTSLHVLKTN